MLKAYLRSQDENLGAKLRKQAVERNTSWRRSKQQKLLSGKCRQRLQVRCYATELNYVKTNLIPSISKQQSVSLLAES